MTDILKRRPDESLTDYKARVCSSKDAQGLTWNDVKDILNTETGKAWGESKYRKWWYAFNEGMEYSAAKDSSDSEFLDKLTLQKLDVQKERVKLQAVKTEINKWVREGGKTELFYEEYLNILEKRELPSTPPLSFDKVIEDEDYILNFADMHYGKEVKIYGLEDELLAEYNVEIFERRMWDILKDTIQQIEEKNIKHLNIFNLADSIDGLLRMTQLQSLQLGVIDQQIGFADFMVQWLNELSKHVYIDYYSVQGNHDEIRMLNNGRGDLPKENAARIINWHIEKMLADNSNITVHKNKPIQYVDIVGTKVLATHGQDERNLESSLKDYMHVYGKQVHILLTGHLHNTNTKTIARDGLQNVEFYQCPSVCGIDDYSMKLKKTAPAGATLMRIVRDKGRVDTHDIKLI